MKNKVMHAFEPSISHIGEDIWAVRSVISVLRNSQTFAIQ